jgi:hypothetical protein
MTPEQPQLGSQSPSASSRIQARAGWLLIAAGLLIIPFCVSFFFYGDGGLRYEALKTLADSGKLLSTRCSYIGPVFSLPLLWLDRGLAIAPALTVRYNWFLLVAGMAAFSLLFRGILPVRTRQRFLLLLMMGSLFTNHVRFFHGEVFTAILVGVGLVLVSRSGLGWLLTVLGVVNMPPTACGLFFVLTQKTCASRRLRYALLFVACVALITLESVWITGQFGTGGFTADQGNKTMLPYSGLPGFSYPFFFGLLSILFSFGKGLVYFAPGLLLPLYRRLDRPEDAPLREVYLLWILFLAGMVAIYAKWWAWYGGWCFGPRFFVFASIPASLALAVYLERPSRRLAANLAVLGALALSLWVGVAGAIFHTDHLEIGVAYNYALEHLIWHVPEFSVLWHPWVERNALDWKDAVILLYAGVVFLFLGGATLAATYGQLRTQVIRLATYMVAWKDWRL